MSFLSFSNVVGWYADPSMMSSTLLGTWYSLRFSLRANASMSSFISSFLGDVGAGQTFKPLRSKSVSEVV